MISITTIERAQLRMRAHAVYNKGSHPPDHVRFPRPKYPERWRPFEEVKNQPFVCEFVELRFVLGDCSIHGRLFCLLFEDETNKQLECHLCVEEGIQQEWERWEYTLREITRLAALECAAMLSHGLPVLQCNWNPNSNPAEFSKTGR